MLLFTCKISPSRYCRATALAIASGSGSLWGRIKIWLALLTALSSSSRRSCGVDISLLITGRFYYLPTLCAWLTLEWPYNILGNPATVKFPYLRFDSFSSHITGLHQVGIKSDVSFD